MQRTVDIDMPAVLLVVLLAITVAGFVGKRIYSVTHSLPEFRRHALSILGGMLAGYSVDVLILSFAIWSAPQTMLLYMMTGPFSSALLSAVLVADIQPRDSQ